MICIYDFYCTGPKFGLAYKLRCPSFYVYVHNFFKHVILSREKETPFNYFLVCIIIFFFLSWFEKSRIRETLNLLTNADSSTNTKKIVRDVTVTARATVALETAAETAAAMTATTTAESQPDFNSFKVT